MIINGRFRSYFIEGGLHYPIGMRDMLVLLSVLLGISPAAAAGLQKAALDRLFDNAALPTQAPEQVRALPAAPLDPLAARLLDADASLKRDPVWPGFRILAQPVLLYEVGQEKTLLIGHPSPPAGYKVVAVSPITVFEKNGAFDLEGPFDYHLSLNGSDTFAYRVEPGHDPIQTARVVTHERFHVFQEKAFSRYRHGEPSFNVGAKTIALAALEQRALGQALLADKVADRLSYAFMFVAIRESRYEKDVDRLRIVEESEEQVEGMARYVDQRTLQRLATPAKPHSVRNLVDVLQMLPDQERLLKWRLYETGAGQGFLLDQTSMAATWKAKVAAGTPVFELMRQAFPLNAADRANRLREAQAFLDYAGLLQEAKAQVRETTATREAALRAFESAPGLDLSVPLPWKEEDPIAMSFTNEGPEFHLDAHVTLFTKMGVYEATGRGFLLRVHDRAIMDGDGDLRFHTGKDVRILLDSRQSTAGDGTFKFQAISITEPGLELRVDRAGSLTIQGKQLKVLWDL